MKSLIITDLHHNHPSQLIKKALERGIEKVVCLGDIETPDIMKYLLDLKIKKRIIIGDHEYHHCHGLEIYSNSMRTDMTCEDYTDLWEENPREFEFVRKYSKVKNNTAGKNDGLKVIDKTSDGNICYVHGSLIERDPERPNRNGLMWGRLTRDYSDLKKLENFRIMKKEGHSILFRGHDHTEDLYSIDKNCLGKIYDAECFGLSGESIILDKNKRHIITVGPFEDGRFAVFDEDKWEINFTSLNHWRI